MSLYSEYLKEKTEDKIIESDRGFLTYRFFYDQKDHCDAVYIIDLYVQPSFRKEKLASSMADQVTELAKKRGCKKMLGSIIPSNKNSTASLHVLLSYGFTLDSSSDNIIWFRKEL